MVEFVTETLESHVTEEAVGERMLQIAAEKHRQMHEEKGEEHHVQIRHSKSKVSEHEEELIDTLRKSDPLAKDAQYTRLSEQSAKGNYGGDAGSYGHSHESAEASCKCGWRETSESAMRESLGGDKEHSSYSKNALQGKTISYQNDDDNLEGTLFQYSGPSDPGSYHS